MTSPESAIPASPTPSGWVKVGGGEWRVWRQFVFRSGARLTGVLVANSALLTLVFIKLFDWPIWLAVLLVVLFLLAVVGGSLLLIDRRYPAAEFDLPSGVWRSRRREAPIASIDHASLGVSVMRDSRTLILRFGTGRHMQASAILTVGAGEDMAADQRAVLAEALRHSTVAIPVSPDDPTGKFARYNFPGALSKENAIDVVEHPPAFGDPLPVWLG